MRFFAHDGQTTHGPAEVGELLKLPGFDGDTLVCPVGSSDSADWKPALAYTLFKRALLSLEPPMPAAPAAPPPPPPTLDPIPVPIPFPSVPLASEGPACPRCAHANPAESRFCNACGARMDASADVAVPLDPLPALALPNLPPMPEAAAPAPTAEAPALDIPAPAEPPVPAFVEPPVPAFVEAAPPTPAEASAPAPAPVEAAAPVFDPVPPPATEGANPFPPFPPLEEPVPAWKKPAVIASAAALLLAASGLAWWKIKERGKPTPAAAELAPAAPEDGPSSPPAAAPPSPPPPAAPAASRAPAAPAAPAVPPPAVPPPPAPKRAVRKPSPPRPRHVRPQRPKTEPPPPSETRTQAPAADDDVLESLLLEQTRPAAKPAPAPAPAAAPPAEEKALPVIGQKPAPAEPKVFSLPGLGRPVSASGRAPSHAPLEPAAPRASAPETSSQKPAPPSDEPTPPAPGDDQLALMQVHEQFEFCVRLLAQGAFGDHFDTCLCRDAREAAPYRGRRGYYVSARKKEAAAGKLENAAKILASKLDGASAAVTARWRVLPDEKGREVTQIWRLEDGLWCRGP